MLDGPPQKILSPTNPARPDQGLLNERGWSAGARYLTAQPLGLTEPVRLARFGR
jgi:hypothetical protein